MYWFYLVIFILAVMVPDIIQGGAFSLSETRVEELAILFLGMAGFLIFVFKERQLSLHKKEQEKNQRKLIQTAKDLVESYSYIGEVNRKMDILMKLGLGLADRQALNKSKEKEIYQAIIDAANFIMKGDCTVLRFIDVVTLRTKKDFGPENSCSGVKNSELVRMKDNVNVEKINNALVVSSSQAINGTKSYLIIEGHQEEEENNSNNAEILKYLAAQALFLYTYTTSTARQ